MKFHTRISLITLGLAIIVMLALIIIGEFATNQTAQRIAHVVTPANQLLWEQVLTHEYAHMAEGIPDLARDFYIRQALKNQDLAALSKAGQTFYDFAQEQGHFRHLHISNPDGDIVFSAPAKAAKLKDNALILQALQEQTQQTGIQRDSKGKLVAVVAFPLKIRRRLIGAGVFIQGLERPLQNMKINDDTDVFIVKPNAALDYSSSRKLYAALKLPLPELGHTSLKRIYRKAGNFLVVTQPLMDSRGKPTAHLISVRNQTQALSQERWFKWGAYAVVMAFALLILIALYRFMLRALHPVQDILNALQRIAKGHLHQTLVVAADKQDEISQIKQATAQMNNQLRDLVRDISQVTEHLGTHSRQMQGIAEQTLDSLAKQNGETEQVSSASAELAASIHEIAQHIEMTSNETKAVHQQASDSMTLVNTTHQEVTRLAKDVEKATRIVLELSREVRMVDSILELIKSIADQTDRLALNAALEAERAADHGLGFRVIAEEVRNLAKRTHQSTIEIQTSLKNLLNSAERAVNIMHNSSTQAQHSMAYVDNAATAFTSITAATVRIMSITEQIAGAIEQQSSAATEISHSVEHISGISNNTAQYAEQTSQSGAELNHLAHKLHEHVAKFSLKT
jgi:methyl-accepting chemotaxis protein